MAFSLLKSLLYTILFVLLIEVSGIWFLIDSLPTPPWTIENYHFVAISLKLIALFGLLCTLNGLQFFNIRGSKLHYYLVAPLLGLLYVIVQPFLNVIYNHVFHDYYNTMYLNSIELSRVLSLNAMATVILTPVTEEFFFRKFIQGQVLREAPAVISILVSTILFSLIHLNYGPMIVTNATIDFHHPFIAFIGGIIAAILYYRSSSVGPPIIFHIFWNLAAMTMYIL